VLTLASMLWTCVSAIRGSSSKRTCTSRG
jgi:hypothetical protein